MHALVVDRTADPAPRPRWSEAWRRWWSELHDSQADACGNDRHCVFCIESEGRCCECEETFDVAGGGFI
ncbi:MAG: hypothetical protein ACTH2J_03690 [Candidatus Microbacterium stercoravium]